MAEQSFRIDGGIEATGIVTATTFAKQGGHSTEFLKADGSVDSRNFSTTDTNTTYNVVAADGSTASRKLIRLNDSNTGITTVTLVAGTNISLTRSGDEITINNVQNDTDTLYSVSAADGDSNKKHIRLTAGGSGSGTDDVTLVGGSNVTLTRSGDEITIATPNNTNTTYSQASIADGGDVRLRLTDSASNDDDILIGSGSNITFSSVTANGFTIASTDTNDNTTYDLSAVDGTSNKKIIRLAAGGSGSGNDDVTLAGGSDITLTRSGNEITIAAAGEGDTLTTVTGRGNVTTNNITVNDLTCSNNLGVSGNAEITGNLTVNGTQTIINSNTLQVGDSKILLNKDETGTPSQNGGVQIERGTSSNVEIRWNETTDKWQLTNDGSTYADISTLTAGDAVPSGVILLWSGAQNAIPSGWSLCDGSGSTPDLRDKFIIGAGNNYAVAATGGSKDAVVVDHTHGNGNYQTSNEAGHTHGAGNYGTSNTGNHSHSYNSNHNANTGNNGSHSHNANMPNHNHVFPGDDMLSNANGLGGWNNRTTSNWSYDAVSNGSGGGKIYRTSDQSGSGNTNNAGDHSHNFNFNISGNTGNTGAHSHNVNGNSSSGGSHSHNVTGNSGSSGVSATDKNLPPYYALCYIRKD